EGPDRLVVFFFSSRRRHTRWPRDWSSDVCSSDLAGTRRGKGQVESLTGRLLSGVADAQLRLDEREYLAVRGCPPASAAGSSECEIGRASCRERGWTGGEGGSLVENVVGRPAPHRK